MGVLPSGKTNRTMEKSPFVMGNPTINGDSLMSFWIG